MKFDELKDPQVQAKLRDAKTPEELLEIAKESGYELDDAQLDGIAGGDWDCWTVCSQRCSPYNICPNDHYN